MADKLLKKRGIGKRVRIIASRTGDIVFEDADGVEIMNLDEATGDTTITGDTTLAGDTTLTGTVIVDGDLTVTGTTSVDAYATTATETVEGVVTSYTSNIQDSYRRLTSVDDTFLYSTSGDENVDLGTDTFTHPAGHGYELGHKMQFSNQIIGSPPTPITLNTHYYVIVVSSTEFKVALTYEDAVAGTAIDLTALPGDPWVADRNTIGEWTIQDDDTVNIYETALRIMYLPPSAGNRGREITISGSGVLAAGEIVVVPDGYDTIHGETFPQEFYGGRMTFVADGYGDWSRSGARQIYGQLGRDSVSGTGHGSSNTMIRTINSSFFNFGSGEVSSPAEPAFVHDNDDTNGASWTANHYSLVMCIYHDGNTGGACTIGVSKNAVVGLGDFTTAIDEISAGRRLGHANGVANQTVTFSCITTVAPGDILRPHTDGNPNFTTENVYFACIELQRLDMGV